MRAVAARVRAVVTCGFILMRVHRVIVVALAFVRIAMTPMARGTLMMPKRHALRCHHRRHALNGHD